MQSGSLNYRDGGASTRQGKMLIREYMVNLFSNLPGKPFIITFPGSDWVCERAIVQRRIVYDLPPAKILGIEFNRSIYKESITRIPDSENNFLVRDDFVNLSFLKEDVTASWIDFVGPITYKRLEALKDLWCVTTEFLAVTSLHGRWISDQLKNRIQRNGPITLLTQELKGATVLKSIPKYGKEGKRGPKMSHLVLGKRYK